MMDMNTNAADKPLGPRLPALPDNRSALMDSIKKGPQLKKVEVSANPAPNSGGDSRRDLLSEIRGRIELRPVSDRPAANRSSGDGNGTDALADALRRALELRKMAVGGSSSSESDDDNDDNDWSD